MSMNPRLSRVIRVPFATLKECEDITLLDIFAGLAIQGLARESHGRNFLTDARNAYVLAEMMLVARDEYLARQAKLREDRLRDQ